MKVHSLKYFTLRSFGFLCNGVNRCLVKPSLNGLFVDVKNYGGKQLRPYLRTFYLRYSPHNQLGNYVHIAILVNVMFEVHEKMQTLVGSNELRSTKIN